MHNPVARTLRIVVFALLLLSAGLAILFSERLWQMWGEGTLPRWAPLGAPLSFLLFMLVFALDRFWAVSRQHYPPTRAIIQVAGAFLLLTLLLPHQPAATVPQGPADAPLALPTDEASALWPAQLLLQYEDETVRRAACDLLAGEGLGLPHPMPPGHPIEALRGLLTELAENDPVPNVREACAQALAQLGPGADLDGLEEAGEDADDGTPQGDGAAGDDGTSDRL